MAGRTTFGPFTLDRVRKRLTRDGQAVPISHRGYVVLEALLDADGAPVSKDALMARAWPDMMIEDGNHIANNRAYRWRSQSADWMKEQLKPG